MLERLKSQNIENVVIFVCDSLRWDFTPNSIKEMGVTVKTVSSSLYTASSFASIISGMYPPGHGVNTWQDILPASRRGLLTFKGYNASLCCETTWVYEKQKGMNPLLTTILGSPADIPLDKLEPPFIYIENDQGGHCPYGYSFDEYLRLGRTNFYKEFFAEYGAKGQKELIKQYKLGIDSSIERFKYRIETLERRSLTESTLIIFMSDHGELLGEYGGLVGHGRPACPELVYVPTIFIHPSLRPYAVKTWLARHVDLLPTVADILDLALPYAVDGVSLAEINSRPQAGLNFREEGYTYNSNRMKRFVSYRANSAWELHGGHVFQMMGTLKGLLFFSWKIFLQKHQEFIFLLNNHKYNNGVGLRGFWSALSHLTMPHVQYLNPAMSRREAWKMITEYKSNMKARESGRQPPDQIDKSVEERLRDLGYLD